MKYLLIALVLAGSAESFAQIATAPDGAANITSPPVGSKRVSRCGKKGCFEIKVMPYCFGTNLRAYPAEVQLQKDQDVTIKIGVGTDQFDVKFPAELTYAADGVTVPCSSAQSGQTMSTAGVRNFNCSLPGNLNLTYSIADWRGSQNPACVGGSHGAEYCKFVTRPLEGNLISGTHPDQQVTCLYTFDSHYKMKDEVKCYFPSMLPDESAKVKLSIAGTESSAAEIKAHTNHIVIAIPLAATSWVKANSQLSKGTYEMPKNGETLPAPVVEYFQEGRDLESSGKPLPDKINAYDEVNRNMSLTVVAKFPGAEGFCGGYYSPLMLFFDKSYPKFNGVSIFPLHGLKDGARVNWPEAGAPGYFLASLAKGEKEISKASQLFGQDGISDNGFESLKLHDSDKNGVINKKDKIWGSLKLWKDENSNGLSEKEEIHSLGSKGVESISLAYSTRDQKRFDNRARVRESSKFKFRVKGKVSEAEILDVWFTPLD